MAWPGPRSGSTAVPGPTIAWANTGSGTPARPTTRPATGERTRVIRRVPLGSVEDVLDVGGEGVGFRAHDDLHDGAAAQDAVRARPLQRRLVDLPRVGDLRAQPGGAR